MSRALLLDLDDTLLDDRGAMADAVRLFRREHHLGGDESDESIAQRWDAVGRALWKQLALGQLTLQQQRRQRLRSTFGLQRSEPELDALFESYQALYRQQWRAMPGAEALLQRTADLPRAVVSNASRPQALAKLARVGFASALPVIVTPDDCGLRKPDPGIFEHALRLLGVQATDAMMIGDNAEVDIAPALALGLRVFHVRHDVPGATILDAARSI